MIPAYLRQLKYMTDRRSWADVARETGIQTRALKNILSAKIEPDDAWKSDIKNSFRRAAYAELRNTGYSSREASRWGAYRPETVQLKTTLLSYKIADLTLGVLAMRLERSGEVTSQAVVNKMYDKIYHDIKRGIQSSRRSTEEIIEGDIT